MKRNKLIPLITLSFLLMGKLSAQTGILSSDGVYVPHLTTANRSAIATPVNGQLIYNTDDNCFNVYQNGAWQKLIGFDARVPEAWEQKANFGGTARNNAVGFSIDNKGYIGTGFDGAYKNDFWEYNPGIYSWTQKADFGGTARIGAVGFSIGNKGYIGTGFDGAYKNDFWEYNPTTNAWAQKADFGGDSRTTAVGFSIDSKGYIGMGYNGSYYKDFWEYDSTIDTWTQKANYGGELRADAVGLSIGNMGYIGLGVRPNGFSHLYDFWEYNPAVNIWTQKAFYLGQGNSDAVGFSIGSLGYVGTGYNSSGKSNDFWQYDPGTDIWTQKVNFGGTARSGAIGFSIDGIGYIGTGFDGTLKNDFWGYNSNTFDKGVTLQGNIFNGPNQLLQLNNSGNIDGSLTVNGDVTISGKLNPESFIAPTLLNSWVNYNTSTYATTGYYKDKESGVHLKGNIKNGTATSGTVLFNLPAGYRPSEIMVFGVTNASVTLGRVDVFPNGDVKIISGGNTFLSLDKISFRVD